MVLVPQVVDIAGEIPVVAAGGIADGRGLAAALALGAQGACLGTRFLASTEMTIADEWKQRIIEADALDAVKVTNSERVMPPYTRPSRPGAPRCLRTPLTDQLRDHPEQVDGAELGRQLVQAILDGRGHEYLPFTGQSAGLIRDIVPAAVILERLLAEADAALSTAVATRAPA
jgi:nitronate monooxygenase/enoyl-[acyl-carrier protein] reductase II